MVRNESKVSTQSSKSSKQHLGLRLYVYTELHVLFREIDKVNFTSSFIYSCSYQTVFIRFSCLSSYERSWRMFVNNRLISYDKK